MIPPRIDWIGVAKYFVFGVMLWICLVMIMAM